MPSLGPSSGPSFGYSLGDQPALDQVAGTDLLLDALAARTEVRLDDPNQDALAALLGDWRDDLRWPPASALVSQDEAEEALLAGIGERRRARRGLAAIGSVAAALLVLSGFGAVVAEARPGDALYGLHAMFFDEPRVNEDQVMLSARADLVRVQQMIDQGKWDEAQNQLAAVTSMVQSMNDGETRQNLMNQVNLLNAKVQTRNPNATLPQTKPTTAPVVSNTPVVPTTPVVSSPPTTTSPRATSTVPSSSSDTPSSSAVPSSSSPTSTSSRPRKRSPSPTASQPSQPSQPSPAAKTGG
jgi:Anti-sigma-D factor RsdA to sigma factor binding region